MINPEFIYLIQADITGIKYARGRAGERAQQVVKWTPTGYRGVPARKPIIPVAARKVNRRDAGAALCKVFGLERW